MRSFLVNSKERKWPRWVKVLLVIAASGTTGTLAAVHVLRLEAEARWTAYAARLRAGGEPLTFAEIDALRTGTTDPRSGAGLIRRLATQFAYDPPKVSALQNLRFAINLHGDQGDFFEEIPRWRVLFWREVRAGHRGLLTEISTLKQMPTGRFGFTTYTGSIGWGMQYEIERAVEVAYEFVHLDSALRLIDGDVEGAVANVYLQQRLSAIFDEHLASRARSVQREIDSCARETIENILLAGQTGDGLLLALAEVVENRLANDTAKWFLLGARARFVDRCDRIASEPLLPTTGNGGRRSHADWLQRLLVRHTQLRGLRMLSRLLRVADDPASLAEAVRWYERASSTSGPLSSALLNRDLPRLSWQMDQYEENRAQWLCTRAALSAERYRLATGRLPDALDDLVPDHLQVIPTDPFDGTPLRLTANEKGLVIYSIGSDRIDDGGIVVEQEARPYVIPDLGFRLLQPEHRGLPLADDPSLAHDD